MLDLSGKLFSLILFQGVAGGMGGLPYLIKEAFRKGNLFLVEYFQMALFRPCIFFFNFFENFFIVPLDGLKSLKMFEFWSSSPFTLGNVQTKAKQVPDKFWNLFTQIFKIL